MKVYIQKVKCKQKGFTLVELIVVIAIIGILAGILLPKYFGFTDDARKAAVISEAKSIRSIAETYYANNGVWPTVNATSNFKIQDGGTTASPTYSSSATQFSGTINISAGSKITDGVFTYTIGTHVATCDTNGNVTGT